MQRSEPRQWREGADVQVTGLVVIRHFSTCQPHFSRVHLGLHLRRPAAPSAQEKRLREKVRSTTASSSTSDAGGVTDCKCLWHEMPMSMMRSHIVPESRMTF